MASKEAISETKAIQLVPKSTSSKGSLPGYFFTCFIMKVFNRNLVCMFGIIKKQVFKFIF